MAIFLTLISILLIFSATFAYLIVTPLGGKILVRYFKQEFAAFGLMHIGHYEGSLQDGFTLKDIRIIGLPYLSNAVLRIQEIRVHLPLWDLPHYDLSIFNARIFIPDSDPVVFTGEVFAGKIKGNLYAHSLDMYEASRFWASDYIRKSIKGFISDADLNIQGPLSAPQVVGSFVVADLLFKSVVMSNIHSKVNLILLKPMQQLQVQGTVVADSGSVSVRKVNFQLQSSKFIFKGDAFSPMIDINLGAKLEDMDFHLTVKGAVSHPALIVSSDPPMPPQDALQVLFTGNAWSSSTSPFNGVSSSQLAENFLDYSLRDINSEQQLGFKTKLTNNLKLGAEMDQLPAPPGETNIYYSRKINGEMDMSDHMSLNVSREVLNQVTAPSYQDTQIPEETQVYVQYKKRF